jgi:hypothetical protein
MTERNSTDDFLRIPLTVEDAAGRHGNEESLEMFRDGRSPVMMMTSALDAGMNLLLSLWLARGSLSGL